MKYDNPTIILLVVFFFTIELRIWLMVKDHLMKDVRVENIIKDQNSNSKFVKIIHKKKSRVIEKHLLISWRLISKNRLFWSHDLVGKVFKYSAKGWKWKKNEKKKDFCRLLEHWREKCRLKGQLNSITVLPDVLSILKKERNPIFVSRLASVDDLHDLKDN